MKFTPSDNSSSFNRTQALECVPTQNDTIQWQQLDNGEILFTYPLPLNSFFKALHRKFGKSKETVPFKKLQLDRMGSFVWIEIDGKKSVREIICNFAEAHKVTTQEAEHAVTAFLKTLGQRGLIALR
ncbi:MAG: PqqD family protein [Proteobacteria bacterium]|nr:PqqD family protein [Pseudomonadota bacterium]MBU1139272.1 PqqD family protein [Pseudomonadota bacterium]MBU1231293.1 PqqD family protein [Pseudomonadota bacterium]MBU1417793.1 PqqD family protein [Pseudomonadota bacterium]MBU1453669.1 PqqD family protein [Pseudomonadota bacterium]